jgi:hypothetical protein
VPDGWIIDKQGGLGILIEVKGEKNSVRLDQLRSHLKRLENYENSTLLVITPDLILPQKVDALNSDRRCGSRIVWKSWNDLYAFFNKYRENLNISPARQKILSTSAAAPWRSTWHIFRPAGGKPYSTEPGPV